MTSSSERFEALRGRASQIGLRAAEVGQDPRPELDLSEVLAALRDLAGQRGREPAGSQGTDGSAVAVGHLGAAIAESLDRHSSARLAAEHAQVLRFNDHLFFRVVAEMEAGPLAASALGAYQPAMATAWLVFPRALFSPRSPARQLLELLVRIGRGLDAYAGRAAGRVAREMRRVALCSAGACDDQVTYVDASRAFADFLHGYQRELSVHEERLMAREHGLESVQDAHLVVAEEIRRAIAGLELPRLVPDFLQGTWRKYLHIIYLREGLGSRAWNEAVEAIGTLVWSVTLRDPRALQEAYQWQINPLLERLRAGVATVHPEGQAFKEFLKRLDAVHMAIMGGEEPDFEDMVRLPAPESGPAHGSEAEARDHPEARTMRRGDWYLWTDGERQIKCRLAENSQRHAYVLFANLSGIKVVRLAYAQAEAALRSGELRRVDSRPVFDRVVALALDDWEASLGRWEAELDERALARQARVREAAEEAREAQERRRAQVRAEAARRREAAQAQAQAEERARAERQARARAVTRTEEAVRRMQPGGVVELIDARERRITCKLALVLRSSRKLVFVDELGRKVAEFLPEDLAARIVEGSAQILDYGVGFDQALQTLIERRKRSGRDG